MYDLRCLSVCFSLAMRRATKMLSHLKDLPLDQLSERLRSYGDLFAYLGFYTDLHSVQAQINQFRHVGWQIDGSSFQWRSRRLLNESVEGAVTTCSGRLFQVLITRLLKKLDRSINLVLGLMIFIEWPLSCVLVAFSNLGYSVAQRPCRYLYVYIL